MENRRSDEPGRREEDLRWLKVQEQVMNLVTTQRTNQQELAKIDVELGKLSDHVEDVDDHLRGVAGQDSLDTRVTILEKEFQMHGALLRRISEQFGGLHKLMEQLKEDVSTIKITKAITEKTDGTRTERLREWLKFWGPIIIASLALVIPLAKLGFDHWDVIQGFIRHEQKVDPVGQMIEKAKHPKGKKIFRVRVVPAPAKPEEADDVPKVQD